MNTESDLQNNVWSENSQLMLHVNLGSQEKWSISTNHLMHCDFASRIVTGGGLSFSVIFWLQVSLHILFRPWLWARDGSWSCFCSQQPPSATWCVSISVSVRRRWGMNSVGLILRRALCYQHFSGGEWLLCLFMAHFLTHLRDFDVPNVKICGWPNPCMHRCRQARRKVHSGFCHIGLVQTCMRAR